MNRAKFVFFIFWSVIVLTDAVQSDTYNRKKGCTHNGKFIPEGTKSYITPCEFCNCYRGKVACAIIDCAPIPSGCKATPVEGQCCPKIECSGGCQYNGQFIPEGNTTKISACEFCTCNNGEVACAVQDCAAPPFGCKAIQIEGQCCPQYDCSGVGCEYDGHFIPEGETKYITPCMFCDCYEGQAYCAIIDCAPIPPECKATPVEGQCCPKIECSGGCQYNGQFIPDGNTTQITPCEWCTCNAGEVGCAVQDCAAPPDGCTSTYVEGQCCPQYDCSGALER